jgi:tetratricopeptide (TPR) repeat protein
MKNFLLCITLILLLCSFSPAADWKSPADAAVAMSGAAVASLESKPDKTAEDIYILTIIYYREFQKTRLKKLFREYEEKMPDHPVIKLLQGIILLGDHRLAESRGILAGVLRTHPDFHPASVTLAHLDYVRKDFDRSYREALDLIGRKKELSGFHFAVSLMVAAGAKGVLVKRNPVRAAPAYFEVTGYLKEAAKQMPGSAEVLYAWGSYYLLTPFIAGGDPEQATALLEKSRKLTPLNPGVYVRLAQAWRARGVRVAAGQYLEYARRLDPQDELLHDELTGEKVFLDAP